MKLVQQSIYSGSTGFNLGIGLPSPSYSWPHSFANSKWLCKSVKYTKTNPDKLTIL